MCWNTKLIKIPICKELLCYRFFAHGDSVNTTARGFRIGKSTAYKIIFETCNVIWNVLQPTYLPKPTAEL